MLRKINPLAKHCFLLLLAVSSAVLLVASYPLADISLFAWIALIPLFLLIEISTKKTSFFYSFIVGICFFGGILYWLAYVSVLGYSVLVVSLAFFFGAFGLCSYILLEKLRRTRWYAFSIFLLAALWVSLEYLRSILFTGFPWALLGYSQYRNPILIQIADITGPYGVSFVIVMSNILFYNCGRALFFEAVKRRNEADVFRILRFQAIAASVVITLVILYGYDVLRQQVTSATAKISVVQGNIPQSKKWDPSYKDEIFDIYETLTLRAAEDRNDLIVWPETSVPGYMDEEYIRTRLRAISKRARTPLLLGAVTYEADGEDIDYYNSAVLYTPPGKIAREYRKIHLVPFGEYIPFERFIPFFRNYIDKPIGDYTAGDEWTVFEIVSDSETINYSVLICFEDIFPQLVRRFARKGADIAINMTNDAWFKESAEQLQHAQSSVFRAVENRIGIVRAANTGYSCYINPYGVIEGDIAGEETKRMYITGYKTFLVKTTDRESLYTIVGDLFAVLCLLGTFTGAILTFSVRRT